MSAKARVKTGSWRSLKKKGALDGPNRGPFRGNFFTGTAFSPDLMDVSPPRPYPTSTLQFSRRFASTATQEGMELLANGTESSRGRSTTRRHFCLTVLDGKARGLIAVWLSTLREIRADRVFPSSYRTHGKLRTCVSRFSRRVVLTRIF